MQNSLYSTTLSFAHTFITKRLYAFDADSPEHTATGKNSVYETG